MFPSRIRSSLLALTATGSLIGLSACATAETTRTGFLSDYSKLQERTDTVRAKVAQYRDDSLLNTVRAIWIEPTVLAGNIAEGFSEEEKDIIVREIDRRICFALSSRFQIVDRQAPEAARLRSAASRIGATDAVGSSAAAVAGIFIPGPIKLRAPGSTGGLAAEAELLMPDGRQAAAVVWARDAQVVGTESPSLSRIGDAHQLTGAFARIVAEAVTPQEPQTIENQSDPCARFGPRVRPEGFVSRFVTGLYTPSLSGATGDGSDDDAPATGTTSPQTSSQTTPRPATEPRTD